MIRNIIKSDIPEICSIYNYYIVNTAVTFEEEPVSADEMGRRVEEIACCYPWIVYEDDGRIIGYAYASRWKTRPAYRHSAEISVYVTNNCLGRGVGKELCRSLITELINRDVHVIIGGMSLPNERSEKLHASLGFSKVAEFKEVGYKFNKWIDVVYWELLTAGHDHEG